MVKPMHIICQFGSQLFQAVEIASPDELGFERLNIRFRDCIIVWTSFHTQWVLDMKYVQHFANIEEAESENGKDTVWRFETGLLVPDVQHGRTQRCILYQTGADQFQQKDDGVSR